MKLTCIHRQHSVITKKFRDIFFILSKDVVIKCPGCESEDARLVSQCFDYSRVTVTLIYSTVGAEKVIILVSINIPYINTYKQKDLTSGTIFYKNSVKL